MSKTAQQTNNAELISELNLLIRKTDFKRRQIAKSIGCSAEWLSQILHGHEQPNDEIRAGLIRARDELRHLKFLGGLGPSAA